MLMVEVLEVPQKSFWPIVCMGFEDHYVCLWSVGVFSRHGKRYHAWFNQRPSRHVCSNLLYFRLHARGIERFIANSERVQEEASWSGSDRCISSYVLCYCNTTRAESKSRWPLSHGMSRVPRKRFFWGPGRPYFQARVDCASCQWSTGRLLFLYLSILFRVSFIFIL